MKLKYIIPIEKLKIIADGIFTSKLCYGITCWGKLHLNQEAKSTEMKALQVLQNHMLRIILHLPWDSQVPIATLLNDTKSLSVNQLLAQHTIKQVKNILVKKSPMLLHQHLTATNGSTYNTRAANRGDLTNNSGKLEITRNSFIYKGIKLWNSLPLEIRHAESTIFKNNLHSWIKSNIPI